MITPSSQDLRYCAIGTVIGTFGFSYFLIYLAQFVLWEFPAPERSISAALAIIGFSFGIALWYLGLVFYFVLGLFDKNETDEPEDSIWSSILLVAWATVLPTIVFLFPSQPYLQLGYTLVLTLMIIGCIPGVALCDLQAKEVYGCFPFHFLSIVLLSLMPTMHALAEPVPSPPRLATAFGYMVITNLLSYGFYLLKPFERITAIQGWRLSLHAALLVLTYSLVNYSKAVLQAVVSNTP